MRQMAQYLARASDYQRFKKIEEWQMDVICRFVFEIEILSIDPSKVTSCMKDFVMNFQLWG